MSWYGFPPIRQQRFGESAHSWPSDPIIPVTESDWPKADPVTTPKVDFTMEAWQRLAMERGDEIARLGELVRILEARVRHLEGTPR